MQAPPKEEALPDRQSRKVRITYEEYKSYAVRITGMMKDMEREGQESILQADLVNRLVQQIELEDGSIGGQGETVKQTLETTKKI